MVVQASVGLLHFTPAMPPCLLSGRPCSRRPPRSWPRALSDEAFYQAKLQTALFYFQRILPRTRMHVDSMLSGADNLMDMPEENFALGLLIPR